jgi:hypothetical protein
MGALSPAVILDCLLILVFSAPMDPSSVSSSLPAELESVDQSSVSSSTGCMFSKTPGMLDHTASVGYASLSKHISYVLYDFFSLAWPGGWGWSCFGFAPDHAFSPYVLSRRSFLYSPRVRISVDPRLSADPSCHYGEGSRGHFSRGPSRRWARDGYILRSRGHRSKSSPEVVASVCVWGGHCYVCGLLSRSVHHSILTHESRFGESPRFHGCSCSLTSAPIGSWSMTRHSGRLATRQRRWQQTTFVPKTALAS